MNVKRQIFETLLTAGSVFVRFDPRAQTVIVPPWLKYQHECVLEYGLNMEVPIPDLRSDEHGVYGTLSFHRTPIKCFVPWNVVFAVSGVGRTVSWPEHTPPEMRARIAAGQPVEEKTEVITRPRSKLRYIKGGATRTTPARGVLRKVT